MFSKQRKRIVEVSPCGGSWPDERAAEAFQRDIGADVGLALQPEIDDMPARGRELPPKFTEGSSALITAVPSWAETLEEFALGVRHRFHEPNSPATWASDPR